jgi:glycine C-acetyltransferase
MGQMGSGTAEHFGLNGQIDLDMGTLSGALGGVGGFVACKKYIADYLRDFSRGFRFTTSLPPATIGGLVEALRIVMTDGSLRARLWSNIKHLVTGLKNIEYQTSATESAIVSIPIGHEQTTWEVVRLLETKGVYVSPFIRPAVKRGQARIRLTVNAAHTDQDIASTLEVFRLVKPEIEAMIRAKG